MTRRSRTTRICSIGAYTAALLAGVDASERIGGRTVDPAVRLLAIQARVEGSGGEMRVLNPLAPHFFHSLKIVRPGRTAAAKAPGSRPSTSVVSMPNRAQGPCRNASVPA